MTSNVTATPPPRRPHCSKARWRAIPIWLACACLMTSCAHGTRPTPEIPAALLALVTPLPPIGEDLKAPCPATLPPAVDPSLAGLMRNHLQAAALYHDCRDRQRRLAAAASEREARELERIERARKALERR
ncbi:hypothetical protein U6S72_12235 [Cutibacterium acnes]|jgi:hypothetical protein